ncbi:MAG: HK97 family phage prohead protease, partial [Pararhodobacter sp.]|nr:HK97 family phage prohead protease [Pararhodobacter sp.]
TRGSARGWGVQYGGAYTDRPGPNPPFLWRLMLAGGGVRMLWQHDQGQPIGVWDEVAEDTHGLRVSGRLLTDVAKGREAAALMGAGAVDGLSIGYRTVRAEKLPGGGRKLYELELWEVSLVTFPMLPTARVAAKHDTRGLGLMEVFARGLDEARGALRG